MAFRLCEGARNVLLASGVPEWRIEIVETLQEGHIQSQRRPRVESYAASLRRQARAAERAQRAARRRS